MPIRRVLVLALLLTACTETLQRPRQATTPLPPSAPVLLFSGTLPRSVEYEVLGTIVVRKATAAGDDWALERLAEEARTVGTNAVMGVRMGFTPLLGAWVAPKGTDIAVRITAPRLEDVWLRTGIQGEWR